MEGASKRHSLPRQTLQKLHYETIKLEKFKKKKKLKIKATVKKKKTKMSVKYHELHIANARNNSCN